MNYSKEFIRTAKLTDSEVRILSHLDNTPRSIAEITRGSRLPRSTVAYHLPLLQKRGLLEKHKVGKRFVWSGVSKFSVGEFVQTSSGGVTVYRGAKEMKMLWYKITEFPKHSRIFVIQPPKSLAYGLRVVPAADAIKISELIKERFIVDGIVQSDLMNVILSTYAETSQSKKLAEAFSQRMEDYVKVDNDFFDEEAEMNLINNHVVFFNWKSEVAVDIHDEFIYRFILSIYEKVKAYGTKYHTGKRLEELSRERLS